MAGAGTISGPATDLGRVVLRLARHAEAVLLTAGLTPSQYRLLNRLADGPTGASLVADALAVSRPSVTGVVDGLVARGLVERQGEASDRRRVELRLTHEGEHVLADADAALTGRLEELLAGVPRKQGERARSGLAAWTAPLDAYRSSRRAAK